MSSVTLPALTPRIVHRSAAQIHEIDPQTDPRWAALVECHPQSSVFHTAEWLQALQKTYGYVAKVFTSSHPGTQLENGLVFCEINSWLTGSRLVSLPFSDHCDPLVRNADELQAILPEVQNRSGRKLRYVEIRPRTTKIEAQSNVILHKQHCLSVIDLRPGIDELYSNMHKNSVQRKVQRAEREHVVIDEGRSDILLGEFYKLLVLTRRRHKIPPQPLLWFRNLVAGFGKNLTIHVARAGNKPIASILTLRHKKTLVYKYGCSDEQFHNLGGMPFLFWHAIQRAKSERMEEFDLGRSEPSNSGLIVFKDRLGARKTWLNYWRVHSPGISKTFSKPAEFSLVQESLRLIPDQLFRLAGEILYRHIG